MANIEQLIRREERRHGVQLKRKDALEFRRLFTIHERRWKLWEVKGGRNGIVEQVAERRRLETQKPTPIPNEGMLTQEETPKVIQCTLDRIESHETAAFGKEKFRVIAVEYEVTQDDQPIRKKALLYASDLEITDIDTMAGDEFEELLDSAIPNIVQGRLERHPIKVMYHDGFDSDILAWAD